VGRIVVVVVVIVMVVVTVVVVKRRRRRRRRTTTTTTTWIVVVVVRRPQLSNQTNSFLHDTWGIVPRWEHTNDHLPPLRDDRGNEDGEIVVYHHHRHHHHHYCVRGMDWERSRFVQYKEYKSHGDTWNELVRWFVSSSWWW
jgi:hypothetical protein